MTLPPDRSSTDSVSRSLPLLRAAVVIPALNEADSIGPVVESLSAQGVAAVKTIIVVDNGSTDGTGDAARKAGAQVVLEARRGYGRACKAGVLAAREADIVVLLDGDGADDPEDLPRILEPLLWDAADLVIGSRALGSSEPGSMSSQQVFGNRLTVWLIRLLYGVRVSDIGPFRAIRRDDLLALDMTEMTYGWSTEMVAKTIRAGYRYKEVPVRYRRRAAGVSKVGGTIWGSLKAGFRIIPTTLRYARWKSKQRPERASKEAS